MHQRVCLVGLHRRRVARQHARVDAVGHPRARRQPPQQGGQRLLHHAQAGVQRGRGQHQRVHPPQLQRHQPRRHQPAHRMAQQDQRQAVVHAGAGVVDDGRQVGQQAVVGRQIAAHAGRFAMAVLVVAAHRKAPLVEPVGHVLIAPHVLAQAVHQQHHAARRAAGRQRPVVQRQRLAVRADELRPGGVAAHHGIRAMTSATAAVNRLA